MPFGKWYLEPVFVSRTLPWCSAKAPTATLEKEDDHHRDDDVVVDDGGHSGAKQTTKYGGLDSIIIIDDATKDNSGAGQVLMAIQHRTMVAIIRQMAQLLTAADQMFVELTDECRRLVERTGSLRLRMAKLSSGVERLNHQMRHSAPKIGNIAVYRDGGRLGQFRWKSGRIFDHDLFTPDSRPVAIRNLYGRAHAPGDVRISCSGGGSELFSGGGSRITSKTETKPPPTTTTSIDLCQCHCGRCHGDRRRRSSSSSLIITDTNNPIGPQETTTAAGFKKPESEFDSSNHNHHQFEYCTTPTNESSSNSSSTSSSSSMVTWSSITSSTAFVSENNAVSVANIGSAAVKNGNTKPKAKISAMSSFSSSGDYYPNAAAVPVSAVGTKTIDDFFRNNNVSATTGNDEDRNPTIPGGGGCTCSCRNNGPMVKSWQTESSSTTGNTINHQQRQHDHQQPDYWCWWRTTAEQPQRASDDRRRWSTAAWSGFKPTTLDEMTIWLRENIETRRPESIVLKSVSETPNDVLLERALSPPCSSHAITLRRRPNGDQAIDEGDNPPPRLKRRWSMMLIRRLSKRFSSTRSHQNSRVVSFPSSAMHDRSLSRGREMETNLLDDSSHENLHDDMLMYETENDDPSSMPPGEVILMSPAEREKLIADRFAECTVVPIDVSGRTFHRMSTTRRSLIHADFRIPRNKIPGHRRSRSKSPGHIRTTAAKTEVSPYALGHIDVNPEPKRRPVTEKGCQTEEAAGTSNKNRILVPIEVHRNDDAITGAGGGADDDFNDRFIQEYDDDEYVVILKKQTVPPVSKIRKPIDDTTSSNASFDVATTTTTNWRSKPVPASTTATTGVTNPLNDVPTSGVNLVIRHQKPKPSPSQKQNGARSSSGNWSAATSDLVRSSSSSSSPPPQPLQKITGGGGPGGNSLRRLKTNTAIKLDGLPASTSGVSAAANPSSHNEEAESVYSVDNDGYYTSMHTDSGLFFSHTLPLPANQPQQRQSNTTTFSTATSSSLAKRQLILERQQQQQKKKKKKTTSSPSDEQYRLSFLSRWKRFAGNQHQQHSTPTGAAASRSTSTAADQQQQQLRKHRLMASEKSANHQQPESAHYGSNVSINSILSNSDAATSAMMDGADTTTAASSTVDFDCSVSRCSHQNAPGKSNVRRMSKSAVAGAPNATNRIRSASGTYDDDGADSISSETLHTNDYDDDVDDEIIGRPHDKGPSQPKETQCKVTGSRRPPVAMNLSTGSSSNSSSCRKLPPPPPPPRVSSMLRTLQKYSIRRSAADDAASSTCSTSEPISSRTDGGGTITGEPATAESETNSEYLLLHMHEERRRRLFLEVDTNRSYPPLSYIYDGADTATSASIPSSVCPDDDDRDHSNSQPQTGDGTINNKSSKTSRSCSSRTITPVPSEADDDQLSNSVINLDSTTNNSNSRKLEERHLSSPLPTPKLDSFTVVTTTSNTAATNRSPKLRSKSSSSSCADSQKLSSTSSLSSSTVKASSSPESKPKPKPRNSLIFNTSTSTNNSSTFSTSTCSGGGSPPDSTKPEMKDDSPPSLAKKTSPPRNHHRRLTTEDLFIILHNSKKRHNIKTDPPLFPPAGNRSQQTTSPTSSSVSGARSPPGSCKSFSPTNHNNNNSSQPTQGNLRRRSWNEPSSTSSNSPTAGRTRTSLALDRLGPVRPTTLTDFKRLLAQVRIQSPPNSSTATATILNGSSLTSSASPSSTTTTYLRHRNQPNNLFSGTTVSQPLLSPSPSSGVSSTASPLLSPLSPPSSISSPERNSQTSSNVNPPSMVHFMKKYPMKSKYMGDSPGILHRHRSPPPTSSSSTAVCPPIPEDDSVCTTTTSGCNNNPLKHNCTSTWV